MLGYNVFGLILASPMGISLMEKMRMFESSRLDGGKFVYLAEGAYGVIFVDYDAARVCKVAYRKYNADEKHCRTVFENEIRAIEMAEQSSQISRFIASPMKTLATVKVLDASGSDISNKFYTDLAFEMAFIDGEFFKIGAVVASNKQEIMQQFGTKGINHMLDASVVLDGDKIVKIVDFSMREEVLCEVNPALPVSPFSEN